MDRTLQILQLNVGKRSTVQQSLLNDENLKDYAILAISEPHIWRERDNLQIVPLHHRNWEKIIPTEQSKERWAIRSMLWVRSDITAVQIPIPSSDLVGAVLHIGGKRLWIVAVYVPCQDRPALQKVIKLIKEATKEAYKQAAGELLETLIIGDFNRHDYLWGGDDISNERQGEAEPITEMIAQMNLQSLLPRGTPTWQRNNHQSTIDLVLAGGELPELLRKCDIYETEHGSDHSAIRSEFDIQTLQRPKSIRYAWDNAPWGKIREAITRQIGQQPCYEQEVQSQADWLIKIVKDTVFALTPVAKPSPYAKRWWSTELTELRRIYTYWRNRARATKHTNTANIALEEQARKASKEYFGAIRKRKKDHWDDFLADNTNIWKATRFLSSETQASRIPPLTKPNGDLVVKTEDQAAVLMEGFFPLVPDQIDPEPITQNVPPIKLGDITPEEIYQALQRTTPLKAPGIDGLPTIVWRQLWPVLKHQITHLFNCSIQQGSIPSQWREAKIIPLRKPGKGDYTTPKAWRPISLLSTLGKILEAVLADRLSYIVEKYSLLPTNHFGARKRRSTEQAITILQEQVYKAWRDRKVVSLISFDVKGAYNGVSKERLLQRLQARRIPNNIIKWIGAFCSDRTASITINGISLQVQRLPQAGLPQGSPLSPILYLFFNADLVQRKIDANQGGIAFVDDYTAWVTGPTARENRFKIQEIIQRATEWERRSGATFEPEKTAYIHFTRNRERQDNTPVTVGGKEIQPSEEVKILGVIMDKELRYRQHIHRAAARGVQAALALKRLHSLSPRVARQLFQSTVIPVVDYANTVWMYARKSIQKTLGRIQKIGAQAIIGTWATVATAIAEAEASIKPIDQRIWQKTVKWRNDLATLPNTHPLKKIKVRHTQRFCSPLQKIQDFQGQPLRELETVEAYTIAPWTKRIELSKTNPRPWDGVVATAVSARNNEIGIGYQSYIPGSSKGKGERLGNTTNQNVHNAALYAIACGLREINETRYKEIVIQSSCQSALRAIQRPKQRKDQQYLKKIYYWAKILTERGCNIRSQWIPANTKLLWMKTAKEHAKEATRKDTGYQEVLEETRLQPVKRNIPKKAVLYEHTLPENVGKHARNVDAALPGPHTKRIYDLLNKHEAKILAQLRTGMAHLNGYLNTIGAAESEKCSYCSQKETVTHFLFQCPHWQQDREQMRTISEGRWGDISYYLGGKSAQKDTNEEWKPNIVAIKATIRFAITTRRLERLTEE